MSVLSNLPLPKAKAAQGGFSLLEMLTVLFIIGAATALATPNLPLLLDRLSFAAERDTLVRDINRLPYVALGMGQDLVLSEEETMSSTAPQDQFTLRLNNSATRLESGRYNAGLPAQPAPLNVPEGWSIEIAEPIFYRPTGFCSGGNITATAGSLRYEFKLAAPYCQINESDL